MAIMQLIRMHHDDTTGQGMAFAAAVLETLYTVQGQGEDIAVMPMRRIAPARDESFHTQRLAICAADPIGDPCSLHRFL